MTGDGSFAMDMAEFVTAADHGIPLTVILLNNGVLGMVRQWQSLFYDRRYAATSLAGRKTDYVALARAFGAEGQRAETLDELRQALEAAAEAEGAFLIDCRIDEDELVLPMMAPGGSLADVIDKVGE